MEQFNIELNGKILGRTSNLQEAKKFAKILGSKAIIFYKGIVI